MNEKFIVDRITQLRVERNVSEYELSYALGFSKSYVNMISREKNLPSMNAFLAICDYFGIAFFHSYLAGIRLCSCGCFHLRGVHFSVCRD